MTIAIVLPPHHPLQTKTFSAAINRKGYKTLNYQWQTIQHISAISNGTAEPPKNMPIPTCCHPNLVTPSQGHIQNWGALGHRPLGWGMPDPSQTCSTLIWVTMPNLNLILLVNLYEYMWSSTGKTGLLTSHLLSSLKITGHQIGYPWLPITVP